MLTYNVTKACSIGGTNQNEDISRIEKIITEHDM